MKTGYVLNQRPFREQGPGFWTLSLRCVFLHGLGSAVLRSNSKLLPTSMRRTGISRSGTDSVEELKSLLRWTSYRSNKIPCSFTVRMLSRLWVLIRKPSPPPRTRQALKLPFKMALDWLSTFVEKVDHTVDYGFKTWPTVDSCIIQKKSQLLQLVNCRLFVDFAVDFSVGKWKNSYKMTSKSSKNSVEVSSRLRGRDRHSCNSLRFFLINVDFQ
jgi:hypothetical protein